MNDVNPYSEVVRVAEYLFDKYAKREITLPRQPRERSGAMRTPITQEEHDKILRLYDQQNITVTELAARFSRSVGVVSLIVNRKHKLYSP